MIAYIMRRVGQTLVFLVLAALLVYTFLIYIISGGPGQQYWQLTGENSISSPSAYAPSFVQEQVDQLTKTYKLDRPWPISFLAWLYDPSDTTQLDDNQNEVPKGIDITLGAISIKGSGVLTGDFGKVASRRLGKGPVNSLLSARWGVTAGLVAASLLLAVLVAFPIGIIAAVKQRTRLEHTLSFFSFAGLSLPPFLVGMLLITFLAVLPKQLHTRSNWTWLPYLPVSGVADNGQENNWVNHLYHLVLPAVTLGVVQGLWLSRYIRTAMLDVLSKEYIRVARAKGLKERSVILKHAFRNALVPIITVMGLLLPGVASGAIVVESVFNYPGMGLLYFHALGGCIDLTHETGCPPYGYPPDYPMALILTLILVVIVALSNLLADILYPVLDPRVNYEAR